MHRRTYLTTTVATITSITGCLDSVGMGEPESGGMESDGTDSDGTDGAHPALANLDSQPVLGPDPADAPALIVSFSDPSCATCARFESLTLPEIESKLVDEGKATYVHRNMPIVAPWGKPAVQALEATFAHDEEAFWALKNHYFENQGSFGTDDVLSKTEAFLAEETDVDAETVVAEAEAEKYDDAVQADLSAGREAGVSATPTTFLFRDDEYVTTITGAKSYSVFDEALGG